MNTGRLILTPDNPHTLFDASGVEGLLRDLGMIANPLPEVAGHAFAAGDNLMRLISFAGCSPFLRFEPEGAGDEDFCHVRITSSAGATPAFYAGSNTKPPCCPHCRRALSDWRPAVEDWLQRGMLWECGSCGKSIAAPELNWRRHAGFARSLVEIFSVFPGEATPIPSLLEKLGRQTRGRAWRFFYWRP